MRHWKKLGLGFVGVMTVSGCLTDDFPHNDVLVFGTKTNLGIDIAAPGASATMPKFTIGYDRQEAVWMPLTLNGRKTDSVQPSTVSTPEKLNKCYQDLTKVGAIFHASKADATPYCVSLHAPNILYVGEASGISSEMGGATKERDTYSVFASFGARGSYSLNGSEGGLAQFFATGIAAQRLGANPQVGSALNAGGPKAAVEEAKAEQEQAKADAEKAKALTVDTVAKRLGKDPEVVKADMDAADAVDAKFKANIMKIEDCYKNKNGKLTTSGNNTVAFYAKETTFSKFFQGVEGLKNDKAAVMKACEIN